MQTPDINHIQTLGLSVFEAYFFMFGEWIQAWKSPWNFLRIPRLLCKQQVANP